MNENKDEKLQEIAYENCDNFKDLISGTPSMKGFIKSDIFPDKRDKKAISPLFSTGIVDLIHGGIYSKVSSRHPFRFIVQSLFQQLECHSLRQGALRLTINMKLCSIKMNQVHECTINHCANSNHLGNAGICAPPVPSGFDGDKKFRYKKFENTSVATDDDCKHFDTNVPSLKWDVFLNANMVEIYSKNWDNIKNVLTDSQDFTNVKWDDSTTEKINSLMNKVGPETTVVHNHLVHQMQLKNRIKKWQKQSKKALTDIWCKKHNVLIENYDILKYYPREDLLQDDEMKDILEKCVAIGNDMDLDMIIAWIIEKIESEGLIPQDLQDVDLLM